MYIVEGNIGAGKSTFLKLIDQHLSFVTVGYEPRHHWQSSVYGQSILTNFYENPKRWAYTMETLAMMCRVKEHLLEQEHESPYRVVERSIYSGHYAFAINGKENGFMTPHEWQVYDQWFSYLVPGRCKAPHGFIYLQTDPEVAYTRIRKRNRLSEKKISRTYLKQIHDLHEKFLIKKEGVLPELKDVPVLVLNCNEEFEQNKKNLDAHLAQVAAFITTATPPSVASNHQATV